MHYFLIALENPWVLLVPVSLPPHPVTLVTLKLADISKVPKRPGMKEKKRKLLKICWALIDLDWEFVHVSSIRDRIGLLSRKNSEFDEYAH